MKAGKGLARGCVVYCHPCASPILNSKFYIHNYHKV